MNNYPAAIQRLSNADGYLPGFEPGDACEPAVKVLAPVHFEVAGGPAVRRYPGGQMARSVKMSPGSEATGNAMIVTGLIYGHMNVRTDGRRILCATLDEKNHDWRIASVSTRF